MEGIVLITQRIKEQIQPFLSFESYLGETSPSAIARGAGVTKNLISPPDTAPTVRFSPQKHRFQLIPDIMADVFKLKKAGDYR